MTSELQEVLLGDFFLFIQGGMVECVRELLPYVSVDQCRSELGSTALIESVKKNNIDLIKLLMEAGFHLEEKDEEFKMTPLMFACFLGFKEIAEVLMRSGASVVASNDDRATSLLLACKKGHVEIVQLLLQAGEIGGVSVSNDVCLTIAAEQRHTELVKVLLEKEFNVNAQDVNGNAALHFA